jgi:putative tricarboxylic transport membrane protein
MKSGAQSTSDSAGDPPAPPGWAGRIPGALLVAVGLAIGLVSIGFDVAFLTDPVGPKALPLLAAAALVLAGALQARRPEGNTRWPAGPTLRRMGLGSAALLVYGLVLPWLGFLISTTAVVAALSHLFGAVPKRSIPAALALTVGLWAVFVRMLALPLPAGDLWMR